MKREMLTQEVLPTLIGTAMYGSGWLDYQFDKSQVPEIEEEASCDTAARILLAGGTVEFLDLWAEEPDEIYSESGYFEADAGVYPVTLGEIVNGMARIESGEWNAFDDENRNIAREDLTELLKGADETCLDLDEADWIMQVILFNEIVY